MEGFRWKHTYELKAGDVILYKNEYKLIKTINILDAYGYIIEFEGGMKCYFYNTDSHKMYTE